MKKSKHIQLCDSNEIKVGMEIYGVGNSLGNGLSIHHGIVSADYKKIKRNDMKTGVIQMDMAIDNGDSGGPVFNDKNELIGIISFRMKDSYGNASFANSYAISVKEIKKFLNGYI